MCTNRGYPKFEEGEKVIISDIKHKNIIGTVFDNYWNQQHDCFCYEILLPRKIGQKADFAMINEIDLEKVNIYLDS